MRLDIGAELSMIKSWTLSRLNVGHCDNTSNFVEALHFKEREIEKLRKSRKREKETKRLGSQSNSRLRERYSNAG